MRYFKNIMHFHIQFALKKKSRVSKIKFMSIKFGYLVSKKLIFFLYFSFVISWQISVAYLMIVSTVITNELYDKIQSRTP